MWLIPGQLPAHGQDKICAIDRDAYIMRRLEVACDPELEGIFGGREKLVGGCTESRVGAAKVEQSQVEEGARYILWLQLTLRHITCLKI